jgi:HAD superfamily hydrolase (TIGR01549 family)
MTNGAVTIDLWHTLVYLGPEDEERYMEGQSNAAVDALEAGRVLPDAPAVDRPSLVRLYDRTLQEAVRAAEEGRTVTPEDQLRAMATAVGREVDVPRYLRALDRLIEQTPLVRAPGGLEALGQLRSAGYRVGVISNTVGEPGRALRPTLHRMGFDAFVEVYTFSDEHPWTKPAPEIFRSALRTLGATPDRAVHIGDGWSDVEGARRAEYRASVLFRGLGAYGPQYAALFRGPPGAEMRPTFEIEQMDEIPAIVAQVLRDPRSG